MPIRWPAQLGTSDGKTDLEEVNWLVPEFVKNQIVKIGVCVPRIAFIAMILQSQFIKVFHSGTPVGNIPLFPFYRSVLNPALCQSRSEITPPPPREAPRSPCPRHAAAEYTSAPPRPTSDSTPHPHAPAPASQQTQPATAPPARPGPPAVPAPPPPPRS